MPLRVRFESPDPDAVRLRREAVGRLRFAMRRLAWLVPRARMQLHDVNGPRGGVDKRCRIELRTEGAGAVVVTAMARDWHAAVEQAVARAARSAVHAWRRRLPARARLSSLQAG